MPNYKIKDFEINKTIKVSASGMAEAMLEYLPWQTIEIKMVIRPCAGAAAVTDKTTWFKYEITEILPDDNYTGV